MLVTFMAASTAAILMIAVWLINYMTRFILGKRSREFAIYLLSGMKKKQIAALYKKENLCPGTGALFAGLLLGGGLQQILFYLIDDHSVWGVFYDCPFSESETIFPYGNHQST